MKTTVQTLRVKLTEQKMDMHSRAFIRKYLPPDAGLVDGTALFDDTIEGRIKVLNSTKRLLMHPLDKAFMKTFTRLCTDAFQAKSSRWTALVMVALIPLLPLAIWLPHWVLVVLPLTAAISMSLLLRDFPDSPFSVLEGVITFWENNYVKVENMEATLFEDMCNFWALDVYVLDKYGRETMEIASGISGSYQGTVSDLLKASEALT